MFCKCCGFEDDYWVFYQVTALKGTKNHFLHELYLQGNGTLTGTIIRLPIVLIAEAGAGFSTVKKLQTVQLMSRRRE